MHFSTAWLTQAAFALSIGIVQATAQEAGPWDAYRKDPVVKEAPPWGAKVPAFVWVNDAGDNFWIMEEDISHEGVLVTAWINRHFATPLPDGTVSVVTRVSFDCKGRTRRTAETAYRANRTPVQEINRTEDWAYIRPDTASKLWETALCTKK